MRSKPCPPTGTGERLVHRWFLGEAFRAVKAGIAFEEWAPDVSARATRPPQPRELEDAWQLASGQSVSGEKLTAQKQAKKKKDIEELARYRQGRVLFWEYVRRGRGFDEAALQEKSAEFGGRLDWNPGVEDSVAFLETVFRPDDLVFLAYKPLEKGIVGVSIRQRDEWIAELRNRAAAGLDLPTLAMLNPVSGRAASWRGRAPTTRGKGAVTDYRWVLLEHDKADLATQLEFLAGYFAVHGWERVGAMTHSGGRSIHVLRRVDARDEAAWEREVVTGIIQPFKFMGGDDHGANWAEMTRLPGAVRYPDPAHPNKMPRVPTLQKLLFLNRGGSQ